MTKNQIYIQCMVYIPCTQHVYTFNYAWLPNKTVHDYAIFLRNYYYALSHYNDIHNLTSSHKHACMYVTTHLHCLAPMYTLSLVERFSVLFLQVRILYHRKQNFQVLSIILCPLQLVYKRGL